MTARPAQSKGGSGHARRARSGHTLTELLVVLTILALFAGLTLPRLAAAFFRSQMEVALDNLRADLSYARARAIATGLRHQVLLNAETRELIVEPFRPDLMENTAQQTQELLPPALRDRLPEEVTLVQWEVLPMEAIRSGTVQPGRGAGTEVPLVCYPEGIGDSLRVAFEDENGSRRGVMLDGFTGEIREMEADELPR